MLGLAALVAGAALLPRPAWALDPEKGLSECTVEVWGLRDGLSGTMVRNIAQTPDGYLWIAAFGGIARFDGARILRIEVEPPMDLAGLGAGNKGQLFVAPRRGPIVCAHGGTLVPCSPTPPTYPGTVRNLGFGRDRAGTLWAATDDGPRAINGPPPATVRLGQAGLLPGPFAGDSVVRRDSQGQLWVGADNGLWIERQGQFRQFTSTAGPLAGHVQDIVEGSSGTMWVLTDSNLHRMDKQRDWAHPLPRGVTLTEQSTAVEDRDGNVWIGAQNGLLRFRDGRFDLYTKAEGLPDDDVTAVFEDREGSLWVGTRAGSIAQFTDRTVEQQIRPAQRARRVDRVGQRGDDRRHVVRHAPGSAPAGKTARNELSPAPTGCPMADV